MLTPPFLSILLGCSLLAAGDAAPAPELWMPGHFSRGYQEREPSFSPDGKEMVYWLLLGSHCLILTSERSEQGWSQPETAPFSGRHSDFEPVFSPDGRHVYFVSNRPHGNKNNPNDSDLWRVTRTSAGWGTPEPLPAGVNAPTIEYFPSICANQVLYFCRVDKSFSRSDVYRVDLNGDQPPQPLPAVINDGSLGANIMVDPQERFLLIPKATGAAGGKMQLTISFRKPDGDWTQPRPLLPTSIALASDDGMRVGPKGRLLYFSMQRFPTAEGIWGRPKSIPAGKRLSAEDLVRYHNGPQNGSKDIYTLDLTNLPAFQTPVFPKE